MSFSRFKSIIVERMPPGAARSDIALQSAAKLHNAIGRNTSMSGPSFAYRGFMPDHARHFIPLEEVVA